MSDDLKKQAALAALDEIRSGMVVGLGTGSTAAHFIRGLGEKIRSGTKVVAIPTSEESRRLAEEVGIDKERAELLLSQGNTVSVNCTLLLAAP